jgi:hypothetical protein
MSHSRRAVRCGSGGGARVPVEEGVGEGDRESLGQNVAEGVGQATREGTFCAYHFLPREAQALRHFVP